MPFDLRFMPHMSDDYLYVPTELLTEAGLTAKAFAGSDNFVILSRNDYVLVFDLKRGTAVDAERTYDARPFTDGEVTYVPLRFTAERFGLTYSVVSSGYGTIIRILSGRGAATDTRFLLKNIATLEKYENVYKAVNSGGAPSVPDTPAPPGPAPSPGIGVPSPSPGEIIDMPPKVFVTFEASEPGEFGAFFEAADGIPAAYFIAPALIETDADAVCRAVSRGVYLGLLVSDDEEARLANERLFARTLRVTRLIRGADAEGYFRLEADADALGKKNPGKIAENILKTIDGTRPFVVKLNSPETARLVIEGLRARRAEFYS